MLRFADIKWDITYLSPVLLLPTVLAYMLRVLFIIHCGVDKREATVIIGNYIIYELTVTLVIYHNVPVTLSQCPPAMLP